MARFLQLLVIHLPPLLIDKTSKKSCVLAECQRSAPWACEASQGLFLWLQLVAKSSSKGQQQVAAAQNSWVKLIQAETMPANGLEEGFYSSQVEDACKEHENKLHLVQKIFGGLNHVAWSKEASYTAWPSLSSPGAP